MTTTVTIVSELRGTFWWPAGEEWSKPICSTFVVDPAPVHPLNHVSTLREAVERVCDDGDSQAAPLLERDGFVELTRHSVDGRRTVIRRFPLAIFGSVADYLTEAQ